MSRHPARESIRFVVHLDPTGQPRSWSVARLFHDPRGIPDARLLAYGSVGSDGVPEGVEQVAHLVWRAASNMA